MNSQTQPPPPPPTSNVVSSEMKSTSFQPYKGISIRNIINGPRYTKAILGCRHQCKGKARKTHKHLLDSSVKMALEGNEYLEIRKTFQAAVKRDLYPFEKRIITKILRLHDRPILGLDSGTGETKILTFHYSGDGVEAKVLETVPSLKGLFGPEEDRDDDHKDKREKLKIAVNKAVADIQPVYCFAGVTSWYRTATEKEQQDLDAFFATEFPIFELLKLTGESEARFESVAVSFAAEKSGIGIPDLQLSAGGGSMQLVQGDSLFSIEQGFRKGQNELMTATEPRVQVCERLQKRAHEAFLKFKKENPDFEIKSGMKIVGISAAFYCAKGAGIDCSGAPVKGGTALRLFRERRDKLTNSSVDSADQPMSKKIAQEIANLNIFCECFEQLIHPDADVFFKREWALDGVPFITTWTAGYFLHERLHPSNMHRLSLLSAVENPHGLIPPDQQIVRQKSASQTQDTPPQRVIPPEELCPENGLSSHHYKWSHSKRCVNCKIFNHKKNDRCERCDGTEFVDNEYDFDSLQMYLKITDEVLNPW